MYEYSYAETKRFKIQEEPFEYYAKDYRSKILFSRNKIFANVFNVFLFHGEDVIQPSELYPGPTEDILKEDERCKARHRDLFRYWIVDGIIKAGLGLECQSTLNTDMIGRIMEYDTAKYVEQIKENKPRYPIYSLILYFGRNKWTSTLSLSKRYNPLEDVVFHDYQMNVLVIPRLKDSYLNLFHNDFRIFFELLKMEYEEKPLKEMRKRMKNFHLEYKEEVLDLLRVFMKDARFRVVQDKIYSQDKEEDNMCWILDAAEAEGRRKEKVITRKKEEELQKERELNKKEREHNQKEKQKFLKELEKSHKREEELQKERTLYQEEIKSNRLILFKLVSQGILNLDYLAESYGKSKEELEKEYRALYPSGLS